ncbi:type II secretion system F family protein, partial [Streptomonospora salina]
GRRGAGRLFDLRAIPPVRRLRTRIARMAGRESRRRRRAVAELCAVLAAELRAGRSPGEAVVTAVDELDPDSGRELAPLSEAARSGHDVTVALRALAGTRGAGGLGHLAACWRVAADTGAGLAGVVDRLSESLAREEALRRELGAQLAGPRATAVLLSVLPALGLGMATALGGSPLTFLFTTPAGLLCLAAGLALDAAGLFWTHWMVRRVLSESGME